MKRDKLRACDSRWLCVGQLETNQAIVRFFDERSIFTETCLDVLKCLEVMATALFFILGKSVHDWCDLFIH
jgi:hypothetical protein